MTAKRTHVGPSGRRRSAPPQVPWPSSNAKGGTTLKPELTLKRAMSQLARWWWIIPICAAAVALAAVSLSSHKLTDPRAVARVHVQDTTVSYQFTGEPQPYTAARTVN